MTVVNPKSISGINSITMASGSDNLLTIHTTNTTERVRVNSDGDVIVGSGITVSPDGDIFTTGVTTATTFVGALTGTASGNTTISNNANNRVITGGSGNALNGESGLTYDGNDLTITGAVPSLKFTESDGDPDYQLLTNSGIFKIHDVTNSADRFSIDSSGRLLIGTTTEGQADADNLTIADSGSCGITIRSGTSAAGSIYFSDATSGAGEYDGAVIYNQSSQFMAVYTAQNERFRIASDGDVTISDGDLVIGTAGHGIDFSATGDSSGTMSSELLSDYEEGTFTPTLYYGSGTSEPTYSFRYGHYIRVGKQVTAWFNLGIAAFTSSYTEAYIGGLPFQSNDPNAQWKYLNHMMGYDYASGWGDGGSDNHIFLAIYDNQTKMMIAHEGNHLSTGNIGSNQRFSCTVTYQTD